MRAGRWRPAGPARAGDFGAGMVRVDGRSPCPICGRDSFCSVLDGAVCYCTKVEVGSVLTGTNDRGTYYMHILDGATLHTRRTGPSAPRFTIARADVEVLHRANSAILSALRLDDVDLDDLVSRRGLDERSARANAYRSSRSEKPSRVARAAEAAVGREAAMLVPGIVWRWRRGESTDRGWLHWRAADGMVIPVRDLDGRVVALKIRRRGDVAKGERYLWVTSAERAARDAEASPFVDAPGPRAWATSHVPLAAAALRGRAETLAIGEGPLKCDLITALCGVPTVAVPGVSSWALGVEVAKAWGPVSLVDVCFDMDADRKPEVAAARRDLLDALLREGFDAGVRRWDPKLFGCDTNGLDDFLAVKRRGGGVCGR